jgi:hypothetical protein
VPTSTRAQIRQALAQTLFSDAEKFVTGTFRAGDAVGTYYGQASDWSTVFSTGHFDGGEILKTIGTGGSAGTSETRRIFEWSANDATFSVAPNWTTQPSSLTADTYEVYGPGITVASLNAAIDRAIDTARETWPLPVEDTSILTLPGRMTYPTPSGWTSVREVWWDHIAVAGDRFTGGDTLAVVHQAIVSGTAASQPFRLGQDTGVTKVFLPLRLHGTGTAATLTLVLAADSSGIPGATIATAQTVSTASLTDTYSGVVFTFDDPQYVEGNTTYWLTLSSDNTQGVRWRGNSSGGYTVAGYYTTSAQDGSLDFRVLTTQTAYEKLAWKTWRTQGGSAYDVELLVGVPPYTSLRLVGQTAQTALTTDAATTTLPIRWLAYRAAGEWCSSRSLQDVEMARLGQTYFDRAKELAMEARPLSRGRRIGAD